MTTREFVCLCEDVTRQDVERAVAAGNTDIESVKRYTGIGTGFCQGRSCMANLARIMSELGVPVDKLHPMTARAPVWPTPLGVLASAGDLPPLYPTPMRPALSVGPGEPEPPLRMPALPEKADVVVIGGGIMGLSTAYHLAKNGVKRVVVLERSYLTAGASGRNGGGIREQWSTEQNVLLMKESIALVRRFATDFGVNVWLRQGGYLFLGSTKETIEAMERNVALQNKLDVPTRMVTPAEARKLVPSINSSDILGGCFNPEDGVLFPWPFLWGYADNAKRLGAHIAVFTPAKAFDIEGGRITGVVTPRGRIKCDLVVNAAGAWSPAVAELVGVKLPNRPERHEILVSESLKPFLGPLVSEIASGLYFSQSARGEIVGGMGDPEEPHGIEFRSSLRFITRMARALVNRIPQLADVKVLRQWAGCYDVTPDRNPIIGEVDEIKGFFQLNGFVGHGFMMAPVVGKIVGEHLAKGRDHAILSQNRLRRFKEGVGAKAESMIIG